MIVKKKFLNQLEGREGIEWSNFWYDRANEKTSKRILLIGDSTSRVIRSSMSNTMNCPVDLFATSAALRDSMFWNQLDVFFKESVYNYTSIFVWVGNHSRRSVDGVSSFKKEDYERFAADFSDLIDYVKLQSRQIIVLSTLHMVMPHNRFHFIEKIRKKFFIKPKENFNDTENQVVEGKNTIMEEIAKKKDVPFYDIDSVLLNSKYWHYDHIHYIPQANDYIVGLLRNQMELNSN